MSKKVWIGIAVVLWLVALGAGRDHCARLLFGYGIDIDACPDGELRQSAQIEGSGLRRGASGAVWLQVLAHYTADDADADRTAGVPGVREIELSLVGKGDAKPLAATWRRSGTSSLASVALPEVPDGDYQLRARYRTQLGPGEVSLPIALYTPARVHVITDRPLYEPGNTVRFRAVVLRARDLAPLDGRPGTWVVKDPDNEVVLEEAAPAGDWGVVAGSFPLDKAARTGTWKVAWVSAGSTDEVPFTVEPFTLPRFRVDAIADRPFYRVGDRPSIKGAVIYSSGAPVAGAQLDIAWDVAGEWPPPRDWTDSLLPRRAQTTANGRFDLALPEVPPDLIGRATLTARISAVDPAGDRVEGAAQILLSKDGIQVSAVTELGDGLVESFNNRLYVRVTTPDGRVVSGGKITVKRAWQAGDRGQGADLDEDGVASLQIDPGAPVNVVIPAPPWRPAPKRALVTRGEPRELIGGHGASLADQVALDRWLAAFAPCAKWLDAVQGSVTLGLRIDAAGAVIAAGAGPSALERCAVAAARQQRLPAGSDRMCALELYFADPELPRLVTTVESPLALPAGLADRVAELARGARDCLPSPRVTDPRDPAVGPEPSEGRLASLLSWRVRAGAGD
ncbi:MAG TPA: MG2 domain-containing protein, partial [Kofleriaceae bacterium]|nr:MG2 domain-containing protein [Kofleriaceae bacterium]